MTYEPIDYLERHYKTHGNFRCAIEFNEHHWKYFVFKSNDFFKFFETIPDQQPNHRAVFRDELIIEGDLDRESNKTNAKFIDAQLDKKAISFEKFTSGNKSFHYHTYWPQLLDMDDYGSRDYKLKLMAWIFDCPDGCRHDKCKIKEYGIDLQLIKGRHLIRLEGGMHNKTGRVKTLLKQSDFGKNYIPQHIFDKIKSDRALAKKWKQTGCSTVPINSNFNCDKFFMSELRENLRKRAAFFVANRFYQMKYSKEEALEKMVKWNEGLNNYFLPTQVASFIDRAYQDKEIRPGCRFAQDLLRESDRLDVCRGCGRYHE